MLHGWQQQLRRQLFLLPTWLFLLLLPVTLLAQEARYTIQFGQGNLEDALIKLRTVTGSSIAFDKEEIKGLRIKSAEYRQKTLEQILSGLIASLPFSIEKRGAAWLVKKNVQKQVQPVPQKGPGRVTGKIVDDENGQPVVGANVLVGGKGVTTDMEGFFTITLPKGNYTATISFVGYGTKEISDLVVKDNETVTLHATLKRGKGQLASVVVRSSMKKESVASLYSRQKNNAAVSDGISSEQISRTPDNNAAQALKRISGLTIQDEKFVTVRGLSERYNNVMLNGANLPSTEQNRKNFSFDIIPAGLIDNIVVNKTATPDLPAEFAGGLVQVNTKDIPAENYATISVGGGINTNSTGKDIYSLRRSDRAWLGYDDGKRTWWGKTWKREEYSQYYFANNWAKAAEMNQRMPNNWGLVKNSYQPMQNYQLALGRKIELTEHSRLGITLAATYRNEQNTTNDFLQFPLFYKYDDAHAYNYNTAWGAVGNIGYQNRQHKIIFRNLYNRRYSQESNVNYGKEYNYNVTPNPDGDDVRYYTDVLVINDLLHNRLEGEHQLHRNLKIDWAFDNIVMHRDQPDTRASMGYQANGPKGYYEYVWGDASGYIVRGLAIFNSALKETKRNAAVNFSVPLMIKGVKQLFKAGYLGTFREAEFASTALRMVPEPGASTSPAFQEAIFGVPDYELHSLLKPGYLTYKYTSVAASDAGEDYEGNQDLHAVYGMADLNFLKRFRLIGGVRMENNRMDVRAISFDKLTGNPVDTLMRYRTTNWLPSANLVYKLTSRMNVRLAYSKTMARADFRERSPFVYYEFRDRTVYRGAIGLKDAYINNFDLRYEYYPAAGEVVSVSFFHKKFINPVELIGIGSAPLQFFYFNLDESVSNGVEIDFRKTLGFIAPSVPWLSNLYVSGNCSWMKANVKYNPQALMNAAANTGATPGQAPGGKRDRPLQGLSPYTINAGIGYIGKVIGATVSYNRFGKRIASGGFNPYQDQYENPRDVIDLQLSANLLKEKLQVRFNISDLLQQDYIIYQNVSVGTNGGLNTPVEVIDHPNPNGDPKGTGYNKEKDLLYHKWFKGRNLSLSFTYKF